MSCTIEWERIEQNAGPHSDMNMSSLKIKMSSLDIIFVERKPFFIVFFKNVFR